MKLILEVKSDTHSSKD